MKDKYAKIHKDFLELNEKVESADAKRNNLEKKFQILTEQIRKDAEAKNQNLTSRLESLLGKLEEK